MPKEPEPLAVSAQKLNDSHKKRIVHGLRVGQSSFPLNIARDMTMMIDKLIARIGILEVEKYELQCIVDMAAHVEGESTHLSSCEFVIADESEEPSAEPYPPEDESLLATIPLEPGSE